MKIALVENFGADFVGARLRLACYLRDKGIDVTAIIPKDGHKGTIESSGIRVIEVGANIRSKGLSVKIDYAIKIKTIFKKESFDVIHFFRLQPNIIGTLIAGLYTNSKIVNHITGLGVAFTSNSFKNVILQICIKKLYKFNNFFFKPYIIYQNKKDAFDLKIHKKTICIEGSAVNESRFNIDLVNTKIKELSKLKTELNIDENAKVFIFVSRLLKEKGVLELVKAFKKASVKTTQSIHLLIVGWSDAENPSSVSTEDIKNSIKDHKSISFLGKRSDVELLLKISHVSILPTYYREGTPRFLLESMVMKNAIITTNMPGCDHLVPNGENGILIEPKNYKAIEASIINILNKNLNKMGEKSYELYFNKFSEHKVYSAIEKLYETIISK